ncbi:MAG: PP2C family protein-serine/threonine phosphatase [Acidobacteriota bacterium]|jgi:phosphoserine phosphatase RsbU/P
MKLNRLLGRLILVVLALASLLVYMKWVNPLVNAPLGLATFNEGAVRAKVRLTSQRVLDPSSQVSLRLETKLDETTLRRMQRLFGIKATSYWTSERVPVLQWSYSVVPHSTLKNWRMADTEPLMTMNVGGRGQILGMDILSGSNRQPVTLSLKDAREKAEDLLRLVGVDVGTLTQTSYNQGQVQGRQRYHFEWSAPIPGLPGIQNQYQVTLEDGYITSFHRSIHFPPNTTPNVGRRLILPLFSITIWFFLALLVIFLFVQKLRRDEVDLNHVKKLILMVGLLGFFDTLMKPSQGWVMGLISALVVAVAAGLFFSLVWITGESFLREAIPGKLALTDLVFKNQWNVRELGRCILWSGATGLLLLGIPSVLLLAYRTAAVRGLVLLPTNLRLESLSIPGGLTVNSLLLPLPKILLIVPVFLGILYPFFRLRFPRIVAALVFSALFSLANAVVFPVGPFLVALGTAFLAGLLLFIAMDKGGYLAGFLVLYIPMVVRNAGACFTAHRPGIFYQGLAADGLLLAGFIAMAVFGATGRKLADLVPYEPVYLSRLRERERFARELEIARSLQNRFLPRETPHIPGFSLSAVCQPAMEVGGDYYDYFALPGGKWLILLGDVSGKGVKAAFYMTLTKGILHAVSRLEGGHTQILCHLNTLFKRFSEDGTFLTLCALVLDPSTSEVQILSAGHNPPFLVTDGDARALGPRGLVLGLMSDDVFVDSLEPCSLFLGAGEMLVVYTDGVTEAMNKVGDEFGMERLGSALKGTSVLDPAEVVGRVTRAVDGFCAETPRADDLTLLVLKADES